MAEPVVDGEDYALQRQLAVVDVVSPISHSISNSDSSAITPFSSPFSLPDGWLVHQVPRSDGLRIDKYYIESETGRRFRSRREVKRYLNVEEYQATRSRPLRLTYRIKNPMDLKMITSEANYYHDTEGGRKFRSLKDVDRHLAEGSTPTKSRVKRLNYREKLQSCSSRKKIVSSGKMLDFEEDQDNQYQLVTVTPTSFQSTSPFTLPDGWIVEEVPRKSGDHIDRYYYEPGTGQKFRSLIAVQKHLAELEENAPLSVVLEELRENNLPIAKAFKISSSIKNHGSYESWKKSNLKKEEGSSSQLSSSPPSKINWVIASSGGQNWNAFIGDTMVPDSLKQEWSERFLLAIDNGKHNPPVSV